MVQGFREIAGVTFWRRLVVRKRPDGRGARPAARRPAHALVLPHILIGSGKVKFALGRAAECAAAALTRS